MATGRARGQCGCSPFFAEHGADQTDQFGEYGADFLVYPLTHSWTTSGKLYRKDFDGPEV